MLTDSAADPLHHKLGRTDHRSKKNKVKSIVVCVFVVAGHDGLHRQQGREEGEKAAPYPPTTWNFLWQCVNPHAASGGDTWRRHAATVQISRNLPQHCMQFQKASQHCYGFFGSIL
jgi:hypothetical protein